MTNIILNKNETNFTHEEIKIVNNKENLSLNINW